MVQRRMRCRVRGWKKPPISEGQMRAVFPAAAALLLCLPPRRFRTLIQKRLIPSLTCWTLMPVFMSQCFLAPDSLEPLLLCSGQRIIAPQTCRPARLDGLLDGGEERRHAPATHAPTLPRPPLPRSCPDHLCPAPSRRNSCF